MRRRRFLATAASAASAVAVAPLASMVGCGDASGGEPLPVPPSDVVLRLPQDMEITVYQATKELLANALKYAPDSPVNIELEFAAQQVRVRVADQGSGFEPGALQIRTDGGFGLPNVRERVTYIGGTLSIDSAPGAGTCCTITVPLERDHPQ